jgi:hypothetical protein
METNFTHIMSIDLTSRTAVTAYDDKSGGTRSLTDQEKVDVIQRVQDLLALKPGELRP